ncbi:hypothetical protein Rhal01_03473 [Rubritalea halochordaticola]|uniref:Ice-binding protein C-terminal domain-containing protein n=1 Tax=Rubritalea halochordaticola TaxID=714537 RepID=A0ABP9V3U0_9BACT
MNTHSTLYTIALLTSTLSTQAAITISHTAADDVMLRESAATTSQEGGHRNLIGGQGATGEFVTLYRFDLSDLYSTYGASGATINSVSFDLGDSMKYSGIDSTTTIELRAYDFDFDAATATWNNPTGSGSDTTSGGTLGTILATLTISNTDAEGSFVFTSSPEFTNYLQTIYDNGDSTVIFRASSDIATVDDNAFIRTDQGSVTGDGLGELIIDATAVPEPSSSALLGLAGLGLILRRRR